MLSSRRNLFCLLLLPFKFSDSRGYLLVIISDLWVMIKIPMGFSVGEIWMKRSSGRVMMLSKSLPKADASR